MTTTQRPLRIAQVAPPLERVPPERYGGTERVVAELMNELVRRGHEVTLFASGDSQAPQELVPTVERALRPAGFGGDPSPWFLTTIHSVLDRARDFDLIHSHLEWWSLTLARVAPVPVVSTFHGRLDMPYARRLFAEPPNGLVAISRDQAATHPDVPWTIIHHGLSLEGAPFSEDRTDAFCFVGRVEPEKGAVEAIEIAKLTGRPLRIAAKVGTLPEQVDYYKSVFLPAVEAAGRAVEFIGELTSEERDALFAESYATIMPGAWPEPFGLVTIESLACGTPVLARRVGALPEIVREGVDGYFGDDVTALAFHGDDLGRLDRRAIRERVIERFSAARMADRYEELYGRMIGRPYGVASPANRVIPAEEPAPATEPLSLGASPSWRANVRPEQPAPSNVLSRPPLARPTRER